MSDSRVIERLQAFEGQAPEIVFEWNDANSGAKGWAVLNSLRGGAAGGGTRMRKGLDRREVESLAKTMEIKFTVSGPPIGGAKSGIDFDPADPRKEEVLRRWYKALDPLLKNYYGTGGDLNVDEIHEVIPYTLVNDLQHPQQGVVQGHFGRSLREMRIAQLREGVSLPVHDRELSPQHPLAPQSTYTVADLITGWGVAESILSYYACKAGATLHEHGQGSWILQGHPAFVDRKVLIQGWGNVAATTAYYLCYAGMRIQGILDREYGWLARDGEPMNLTQCLVMLQKRLGNAMNPEQEGVEPYSQIEGEFWQQKADVFVPAAASRLIALDQINSLMDNGLELVSSGANVPFADPEIFMGPISRAVDRRIALIPDFVANCGMARVFGYLMQENIPVSAQAIFRDVATVVRNAVIGCMGEQESLSSGGNINNLSLRAYNIALDQLMSSQNHKAQQQVLF
jgi:glutamate dehydrogenase (NAD(P)+)